MAKQASAQAVNLRQGKRTGFTVKRIQAAQPAEPAIEPDTIERIKAEAKALADRLNRIAPTEPRALEVKASRKQADVLAQLAVLRSKKSAIEKDIDALEAPLREFMTAHNVAELSAPAGRYCAEARSGSVQVRPSSVSYILRS